MTFRVRSRQLGWVVCAALLQACSSGGGADASVVDAASALDAGAPVDARVIAEDAQPRADALVVEQDAAEVLDAEPTDAPAADATPGPADAEPVDAGGSTDAGPECPSLVGFPCTQNGDCEADQICLNQQTFSPTLGPAAGYCSKPCSQDADCGPCGVCNEDPGGEGIRVCLRTCLSGGRCEVSGQLCHRALMGIVPTSTSVCYPANPTARIGDPCRVASDCGANQGCYNSPWWVDGICVGEPCSRDAPDTCPSGTRCANLRHRSFCLPECLPDGTCSRPGYICVPETNHCAQMWGYAEPGSTCTVDSDCGGPNTGLACLRDAAHPEGYCTRYNCSPQWPECSPYQCASYADSCPFLSVCTPLPGSMSGTYCARRCDASVGCRQPYTCQNGICD